MQSVFIILQSEPQVLRNYPLLKLSCMEGLSLTGDRPKKPLTSGSVTPILSSSCAHNDLKNAVLFVLEYTFTYLLSPIIPLSRELRREVVCRVANLKCPMLKTKLIKQPFLFEGSLPGSRGRSDLACSLRTSSSNCQTCIDNQIQLK